MRNGMPLLFLLRLRSSAFGLFPQEIFSRWPIVILSRAQGPTDAAMQQEKQLCVRLWIYLTRSVPNTSR